MISMSKEYRTKNNYEVRVLCVDRQESFPVIALVNICGKDVIKEYTEEGVNKDYDQFNLVEYNPLYEFKLDDPIMVRMHDNDQWLYRHFAGIKEGKPTTFDNGRTSFTNNEYRMNPSPWTIYRKPTKEELAS
jgi:hypothetical protein